MTIPVTVHSSSFHVPDRISTSQGNQYSTFYLCALLYECKGNMMIDKYVNKNWRIYPGTGKEIGNYIYVEDAAMGHVLAMEKGRSGECYILGGENLTYIQFFQAIAACSGIKRKMIVTPYFIQKLVAHLQLFMANCFGKEPDIVPNWLLATPDPVVAVGKEQSLLRWKWLLGVI